VIKAAPTPWQAPIVVVNEVTDPDELAKMAILWKKIDINSEAFERFAPDIYKNHRDKFVCVAGGQLFIADTSKEVLGAAKAAFPNDNGRIIRYIPKEKLARI
jgi:hypothetical protein